ncbi:MAG: carbon-nitrogen hydrolase family protein [Opitutia bacterium]|nr:MAG: carbon-nitrogen hydrolase family protein [Opitutae bacterium]
MSRPALLLLSLLGLSQGLLALERAGWTEQSPRDEIRPAFSRNGDALVITHDAREGLDGWYQQKFRVVGGDFMKFSATRKTTSVENPRHSGLVRIVWSDATGKAVPAATPGASAEPEHPIDGPISAQGISLIEGVYQVPPKATQATIELHLQHAPKGRIEWRHITFEKSAAPASRKVRLATVQYIPTGKSPRQNCEEYAPMIAEAAKQKADLIVLGETVPYVRTKLSPAECAEPIPGPTTEYFGSQAKLNGIHIAVSLYEREGHLVYNTAVLLSSEGKLLGKYRKVCLPHGEVEKGVAPGTDYPVFDTKFGKVGLMICYDGFYPEVARALTANGAEVIAWPVWGCDPLLARARACENRVYVVSSTFTDPKSDWMISAVIDRAGKVVAQAKESGSVVVTEADLSKPLVGPYNLGDFHGMVQRHRPEAQK